MGKEIYECCACGECFESPPSLVEGFSPPDCPYCGSHITFLRILADTEGSENSALPPTQPGCHPPVAGTYT